MRRPGIAAIVAVLVGAAALGGCVGAPQIESETCAKPSIDLAATLPASGSLQPQRLEVCRDQKVTIAVTAERAGVLHLHGYDDQNVVKEVRPAQQVTLAFTADHPGQFVIELHPETGPSVGVGILTVHEK
jgi:hypothetical protein